MRRRSTFDSRGLKDRKLTVVLPDGTTASRRTPRDYRYAVAYYRNSWWSNTLKAFSTEPKWFVFRWSGTEKAAQAAVNHVRKHKASYGLLDVRILEVRSTTAGGARKRSQAGLRPERKGARKSPRDFNGCGSWTAVEVHLHEFSCTEEPCRRPSRETKK